MALGIIVASVLGYYCFKDYLRFRREVASHNQYIAEHYLKIQQKEQELRYRTNE